MDSLMDRFLGKIRDMLSGLGTNLWSSFLDAMAGGLGKCLDWLLRQMEGIGLSLFSLPWVQALISFIRTCGTCLFFVGCILAVFETALEYQSSGRISVRRQILPLLFGFLAAGLFTVVPTRLYAFCVGVQGNLTRALRLLPGLEIHSAGENLGQELLTSIGQMTGLPQMVMLLLMVYGVGKCFLDNLKRGGILLLQMGVGALHLFFLPRGQTDGFSSWCRQIAALCFTAFMQTTLLLMGILTARAHPLLGAGVVLSAAEVPRIAQQFGLDTGVRFNALHAVNQTGRMMMLMRSVARH